MLIKWIYLNPIETKRTYHFDDNTKLVIENVTKLEVRESGKHRLETQDGKKFFISPNWLYIEIESKDWTH